MIMRKLLKVVPVASFLERGPSKEKVSENAKNPIQRMVIKFSIIALYHCYYCLGCLDNSKLESSDEEQQQTIVRPTKRKTKSNPNIQKSKRLEKKQKNDKNNSGSDSDEVLVSYKSTKSAMPLGPQDQGATATLVSLQRCIFYKKRTNIF